MTVIENLIEIEREFARLHARQLREIASLHDPSPDWKGYTREEVAAALRWSEGVTRDRFHVAAEVVERFPELLEALDDGEVSFAHVASFCELTVHLDEETAALVLENVLDYARTHTVADLRRKIKRELLKADPVLEQYSYEQALEDRTVWSTPDSVPGITRLGATLPAEGAAELMGALDFLASTQPDDGRTKQQRMADALVQLGRDALAGGCSHCKLPARVVGPTVNVTVALSTLLELDDQPGELNGEPIPAELARALANDETGTWRRLLTDEQGHLVDYGRTTYRPPAPLREHVIVRWDRCVFPGCHRRASKAELDHVLAWEHGGETNADNLVPLCARHHHLKHDTGWQLKLLPSGTVEWTDPAGRTYTVDPKTYPLDRTRSIVSPADIEPTTDSNGTGASIPSADVRRPHARDPQPPGL